MDGGTALAASCASAQVLCGCTVDVLKTLLLLLLFMRFEWIKRINVVGSYKKKYIRIKTKKAWLRTSLINSSPEEPFLQTPHRIETQSGFSESKVADRCQGEAANISSTLPASPNLFNCVCKFMRHPTAYPNTSLLWSRP